MPYTIKKEKCKKSDGGSGTHRLRYTDKKGKKHSSCHTSKKSAQGAISAIEMRRESDDNHLDDQESVVMENHDSKSLIRSVIAEVLLHEAGDSAERQERGFIQAIKKATRGRNPVTVMSTGSSIANVIDANKVEGLSELGKEPYTDIVLTLSNGKSVNVSAKGSSAPSLAGGGLVALKILVPDLVQRFLMKANSALIEQGYRMGDESVPDVYGQISPADSLLILTGNKEMGGPIHFMYQGPMDVEYSICTDKNECSVKLNGSLTPIRNYAKSHKLYLRARKRRVDQPFDPKTKDADGLPVLYGKSPSRGDTNRRIVITDKTPANAIIVKI